MILMFYLISRECKLVNKGGVVHPLKVDDFDLMDPYEKHQDRNKGDVPFKMICWVPKEFE